MGPWAQPLWRSLSNFKLLISICEERKILTCPSGLISSLICTALQDIKAKTQLPFILFMGGFCCCCYPQIILLRGTRKFKCNITKNEILLTLYYL